MKTIYFIEDMAICREPLAAMLRLKGFTVLCAADGLEGMRLLEKHAPDLVLLDVALPHMDGLTILRNMRSRPTLQNVPVILLTAVMERDYIVQARTLGAKEYLLKSQFSFEQLLARVRKHLAFDEPPAGQATSATPADSAGRLSAAVAMDALNTGAEPAGNRAAPAPPPRLLTRKTVIERLEACKGVKAVAGVVAEIMALASSSNAAVHDVVTVIKRDPAMASRVLQAANSAAFASNNARVSTVEEAARNVGMSTIRSIAASVGVFESVASDAAGGHELMRCWQHSFAVADIMARLAGPSNGLSPGLAHLSGLCHDLGEIVLRIHFATEFAAIVAAAEAHDQPLHVVTPQVLGMPMAEISAAALGKLGLPATIADPIREFHEAQAGAAADVSVSAKLLQFSNSFSHGMMLASTPAATVQVFSKAQLRDILPDPVPALDPALLRAEIITMAGMLARLTASQQESLAQPLAPRQPVRVCYVRHPLLQDDDPIGALLNMLCEVQVSDRLPAPGQSVDYAALVVAAPKGALEGYTESAVRAAVGVGPAAVLRLVATTGESGCVTYPVSIQKLARFVEMLVAAPQTAAAA